jgi:hypothetical protein
MIPLFSGGYNRKQKRSVYDEAKNCREVNSRRFPSRVEKIFTPGDALRFNLIHIQKKSPGESSRAFKHQSPQMDEL